MAKTIISLFDSGLRLAALAAIWGAAGLVLSAFVFYSVVITAALALVGLPIAFIISHVILSRPFITLLTEASASQSQAQSATAHTAKAKRSDTDLGALLALLDDDDAYELRQRIKHRLMDSIDDGDDDAAATFEELLDSRERQKRR